MTRLLALDQASRVTGWAVFIDGTLFDFGKINATQEDVGERLVYIREQVLRLIKQYEINEVAFEDIQLQDNVKNNVQTFKVLAEVFGTIYELVTELNIPHTAVLAGTWKSTLGIKGAHRPEQKKNAQLYVLNTFKVKATQDESDAICIGAHMSKKNSIPIEDDGFYFG